MKSDNIPLRKITYPDKDEQPSKSDEETLRLLFNDIFISNEKSLFKLAHNLTKDKDIALDIVHDVFMKLWEIRSKIYELKSIEAFLFILTRNKVMDHLRKISSDNRLKEAIWQSMQHIVIEQDSTMEQKEFQEQLQKAINDLPPQRKVIYMMRDEGYNYNEIANKLRISRHTVKNQISAAIKSIRKLINNFHCF